MDSYIDLREVNKIMNKKNDPEEPLLPITLVSTFACVYGFIEPKLHPQYHDLMSQHDFNNIMYRMYIILWVCVSIIAFLYTWIPLIKRFFDRLGKQRR